MAKRRRLFGRKGIEALDERAKMVADVDPFDLSTPFQGDLNQGGIKNNVWVNICVEVLSRCVLRADYILSVNGVEGPTPFDIIFDNSGGNSPANTTFQKTAMWYHWEGEFFWYWESGYRIPEEVTVLDPRRCFHSIDGHGKGSYFFDDLQGHMIPLTDQNSLHVMKPNIYNPYRGVFPLYSVGTTVLKQDSLINSGNVDALKNGANPDVVLKHKLRITEKQAKDAVQYWNNAYGRQNGGSRVAVLGSNTDVIQLNLDLIKYMELLDWNRTTILATYGVPLKVANAETGKTALSGKDSNEQYRALFSQTVIPTLEFWAGEINRQFFARLGHPKISGKFSLAKVAELQEDENKLSERENADITVGKVTINEVRARHGLDSVAWGDLPPTKSTNGGKE